MCTQGILITTDDWPIDHYANNPNANTVNHCSIDNQALQEPDIDQFTDVNCSRSGEGLVCTDDCDNDTLDAPITPDPGSLAENIRPVRLGFVISTA